MSNANSLHRNINWQVGPDSARSGLDEAESLAALEGKGVGDFLGQLAIGGLGVEELGEDFFVELVSIGSLRVDNLHESAALVLLKEAVLVHVVSVEKLLEHGLKLGNGDCGKLFSHLY